MQGRKHYFVRITSPMPYPLGCPERRFLQALSSPRAEPSQTHSAHHCASPLPMGEPALSPACPVLPTSTYRPNGAPLRPRNGYPVQCLVRPCLPIPLTFTGGFDHSELHLFFCSLATSLPGLPTGSKADASFEATGDLSTWPLPFGDLALASWQ